MAKNASAKQTFTATWKYNDEDAGYLRLMRIMIVLMRSQFVTLLTRDPSPTNQVQLEHLLPVVEPSSSYVVLCHEDMLEMRMQALLIILIAMLVLLMMVAWEHYPNSGLSKWSRSWVRA